MLPEAEVGGEGIALNGAEAPTVLAGSVKAGPPTEGLAWFFLREAPRGSTSG